LSKRNESILWAALLLLAAGLRLAPIAASLPYIDYIDEGYALHQTIHLLKQRTLDTAWYGYPSLPAYLTAVALTAWNPIYRHVHGHSFRRDFPREEEAHTKAGYNYDLISPPELIVAGRAVAALLSVATVVLAGAIASRLHGRVAGLTAMLITALCPALVLRGSNLIVDTFAAFFALLAIYFSGRIRPNDTWNAAIAGFAAGLGFASKYSAGAVFVAVVLAIWTLASPKAIRLRLGLIASGGLLLGIALGAPATFLQWRTVMRDVAITAANYHLINSVPGYFGQAVSVFELGWPLVLAGGAGVVLMFSRSSTRGAALGWCLFAAVLLAPFIGRPFQPFRNLLPLVPLFCIAAAITFADLLHWARQENPSALRSVAAIGLIVGCAVLLATSSFRPMRQRMLHRDSRVQAIDWLQQNATKEETVLGVSELAILPAEWERLAARPTVVSWFDAAQLLEREQFDYVVAGEFDLRSAPDPSRWTEYHDRWRQQTALLPVQAAFGAVATPAVPHFWRTNDERIVILQGRPRK
jgi:Dolichyl-phosphate-mannose-protein mannosyltransferase